MLKILGGLLAVILIAAGGYFGFELYAHQRIAADIDAAFATVAAAGGKASHGKVTFDLWSRTVEIADIAVESTAPTPLSVKIAQFTAVGAKTDPGRFAADRIVAADVEVNGTIPVQARPQHSYKAPRIEIANYAGPAAFPRPHSPAAPGDIWRLVLEQFAAVSATSVVVPSLSGHMTAGSGATLGDYTYAGLAFRDLHDGKIAAMTVDRVSFTAPVQSTTGKADTMTGEVADLAAYDFDSASTLALFDPARGSDDKYYPAYRQMKFGAYTVTAQSGMKMRMDGMAVNEIGLNPARLQYPKVLAVLDSMPQPGTAATPQQTRALMDKAATLYEGFSLGSAELRGFAMDLPQGPFRLGAIKLGKLENGKLQEFALEGLDAPSPQGPVKLGRFALRTLDIANLLRVAAQLGASPNPPPEQLAGLLLLLEGAEIRNLTAPYKNTGKPVNIDTLTLGWGQFVGPIPTKANAALRMSGPIEPSDREPFDALAAAGMQSATINLDLGAAWDEGTHSFALEPVTVEIGGLMTAAARLSFANVPREVFSLNPLQVTIMAAQINVGALEIALRDNGGVDLALQQYARKQNISLEEARRAVIEDIRLKGAELAATNPDAQAIAGAVTYFIENPRGTLTVKLTPRGRVALMEVIQSLKGTPLEALAQFRVDASNGR
ncbi:MAG TPA: hypothetical protein VK438_00865 [Xanthobacteraceae bacterium]|nr:hypothetical protein [Xanthobacteraceae bacterium]